MYLYRTIVLVSIVLFDSTAVMIHWQVAVVVARYAGMPEMVEKIREAVKTHQKHEHAEAAAVGVGIVLEKIIVDGLKGNEAIEWALHSCDSMPHIARTWWVSKCGTCSSLQDSVHSLCIVFYQVNVCS